MKIPEILDLRVLGDGLPLAGMFVGVGLLMNRKSDFNLSFGPTNEHGEVSVTEAQLREQARQEWTTFPMDYGRLEQDFTGRIVVTPRNRDSLRAALDAYDGFRKVVSYPPTYRAQLEGALQLLEAHNPNVLTVVVARIVPAMEVKTTTVPC